MRCFFVFAREKVPCGTFAQGLEAVLPYFLEFLNHRKWETGTAPVRGESLTRSKVIKSREVTFNRDCPHFLSYDVEELKEHIAEKTKT